MNTSLPHKFDLNDPLQVAELLVDGRKPDLASRIGRQIQVESLSSMPQAVVLYKIHAENGDFILRFPMAKSREEALKHEALVSGLICPLTRVDIPETDFYPADDQKPAFAVHQWIPGEPLTTEMYCLMSLESKQQLVNDLVDFLMTVHSIRIQKDAMWPGWSQKDIRMPDFGKPMWFGKALRERIPAIMTERLQPEFANSAIRTVKEFEELVVDGDDLAFVHGDIHGFNLAMRRGTQGYELGGIFDFETVGVLDIHEDFFRLYFISPELVKGTIQAYNQKSKRYRPLNSARINLYWRAFLLYLMMENLEAKNHAGFHLYEDIFIRTIKAKK